MFTENDVSEEHVTGQHVTEDHMTGPTENLTAELWLLLASLRSYGQEERQQAEQETDERRRAWHDGRASAYEDVIERLAALRWSDLPGENGGPGC